jgi:hypothetical protein
MWDYIAEAHRLDLHHEAEAHRLVKLARIEHPSTLGGPLQALRRQIAIWREARTKPAPQSMVSTQEIHPCADAG